MPWDLLIVDEAHNLMPSNFGQDSDLAEMLRSLALLFEHKLFLSATPHNGHTRCFSGLLEQLDPVRFTQTSDFTPAMQQRTSEVLIRRLKREINEQDKQVGKTPRFGDRKLHPIPLFFGNRERDLAIAFDTFRTAVKRLIATSQRHEQLAGNFAVDVLNKRLLSCPYTFANSWRRFKDGIEESLIADYMEVKAAEKAIAADIDMAGKLSQPELAQVWADLGYRGRKFQSLTDSLGINLTLSEKREQDFKLEPRRWVVERTFAWLGKQRRLSKDYESLQQSK